LLATGCAHWRSGDRDNKNGGDDDDDHDDDDEDDDDDDDDDDDYGKQTCVNVWCAPQPAADVHADADADC
jgi:hypothetical protein